jgi:drug/metabolite transporter (DMT)-like permease
MRPRRTLLAGIICGTVLVATISFLIHYYDPNPPPGRLRYMTPWTRDLNFAAAILNLGLWVLLIGSRQKDRKLLLITGGLGLQFTGGAIGQALRDMSPTIVAAASDFLMLTNVARIYIWWVAFRGKPKTLPPVNGSTN